MDYKEVAIYILHQQLFAEPNLIRDRRSLVNIPVEGSDVIINKMLDLVLSNIELWEQGKEKEYITKLVEKIGFDPKKIFLEFHIRLKPIPKEQVSNSGFKYMLAISEVIKTIHEQSTDKVVKLLEKKFKGKKRRDLETKLQTLSEQNNLEFSLLLNLAILKEYAEIIQAPYPIAIFNEYFEKVLQLLN
ncbi:MAG: hypothetical protein ACTSUW_03745 [Candidatus Heimdallarchaeota archaeon]|nr:hypothetical protein [Candidatus Heimdallarchaeota archaeon]